MLPLLAHPRDLTLPPGSVEQYNTCQLPPPPGESMTLAPQGEIVLPA